MTNNWYIVSVGLERVLETDTSKKVTEKYLVDAMTPSEAELRLIMELKDVIVGEFKVKSIVEEKISEMFFGDSPEGSKWYKAAVNLISLDEKSGAEKKTKSVMYILDTDIDNAIVSLKKGMRGTVLDWEIFSITETQIIEVVNADNQQSESNNN
ncbi:MAG: DUF4494 domain-containing protein [Paludibacteraceae bacterium]|nr:DUF4494 domain-containing protein [Paludibacteraceae bacterium]